MIDKFMNGFLNRVYDLEDYTQLEINSKLIQKIDEVIDECNNAFEFVEWLKEQGVPDEVQTLIDTMLEDGTLEKLINIDKLNKLEEENIDKLNQLKEENIEKINQLKEEINSITYLSPITSDVTILQAFIDTLPNNANLKFPKNTYLINDVLVIKNKSNITIDLTDVIFQTNKHGYGILEFYACENVTINGGTLIGAYNFYPNTINADGLINEKTLTKSFWGSVRNSKNGITSYNNGFLGSCGIGLLIHQSCKNITVNNL